MPRRRPQLQKKKNVIKDELFCKQKKNNLGNEEAKSNKNSIDANYP
jgi:hypothetical protein